MEDSGSANRDIKNHMLFEISTEVANRGGNPPAPAADSG
jgi:hypothetical protein